MRKAKFEGLARTLMVEHHYVPMAPIEYMRITLRKIAESGDPVDMLKELAAEAWKSNRQLLEGFLASGSRSPKAIPHFVLDLLLATGFLKFVGLLWDLSPTVGLTVQSWVLLLARDVAEGVLFEVLDACFEVRRSIVRLFMEGVGSPHEVKAQVEVEAPKIFESRLAERPRFLSIVLRAFDMARGELFGDIISTRASLHHNGVVPLSLVDALTLCKF